MKILWNISSHGLGHAARQRELIRVYKQLNPNAHITIASDVPDWFWDGSGIDTLLRGAPSPIVKEKNGDIDLKETRTHFLNFFKNSSEYLELEKIRQLELNPDLVISDIDPLPVKAAEINGIPALGIGNFTWDWIIQELIPDLGKEVETVTKMYRHGTYLKLPLGPDYSPFSNTVEVPLLRGGPPGNRETVRTLLPSGKLCLLALRELPPGTTFTFPDNFTVISCLPDPIHPICCNITPEKLSSVGATFSDLVDACDVTVSKPGYGVISQILTMRKKAVLFTGRNFPEEEFLLAPLQEKESIKLLPINAEASLSDAIAALTELPEPLLTQSCQAGGAEAIVDLISSLL